ncbi:MAG TPA: TIGR03905 family TSCPD domain-containing protein [Lachnospiraceae bacterium]|nr:TIGR03905 family TSCPD domain-containing protein [Lachnospiraceae bacterium]
MKFKTSGVCCHEIEIEIDNNVVQKVTFLGGCSGNTQGIAKLVEGMPVEDVIERLEGLKCGFRSTSCPDQLAKALKSYHA